MPTQRTDSACGGSVLENQGGGFAVIFFPTTPGYANLFTAERHVVQMVLDGFSNREISWLRAVRLRTVVNQVASIFGKLGVTSRRELVSKLSTPSWQISRD